MLFLQLDPLSKPLAITEMVLLLAGMAFLGWLVARWVMAGQIRALREVIGAREVELDECRAARSQNYPQPVSPLPVNHFVAAPTAVVSATDNLKLVEGIGPKIEELLNASGILTLARLAVTPPERLSEILKAAGPRFQMHNPGTWPEQAALARDGKWEELKAMQTSLRAGRS